MTTRGRMRKPEDQRTGHRDAVGQGKAMEVAPVQARLVGAAPPEGMSPIACEIWKICVADLADMGHLREPDLLLMRAYCETAAIMVEAEASIKEHGALMKQPVIAWDPDGAVDGEGAETIVGWNLQVNPAVKVHGDAMTRLRLMSNELALNPLARIRGNLLATVTASYALGIRDEIAEEVDAADKRAAKKKSKPRAKATTKKTTPARSKRAK